MATEKENENIIRDIPAGQDQVIVPGSPKAAGIDDLQQENRMADDLEDKRPAGDAGPEDALPEKEEKKEEPPY